MSSITVVDIGLNLCYRFMVN